MSIKYGKDEDFVVQINIKNSGFVIFFEPEIVNQSGWENIFKDFNFNLIKPENLVSSFQKKNKYKLIRFGSSLFWFVDVQNEH